MFNNSLQTFGRNPNYLHHCQLQADAPEKEKETEKKQFKVDGCYITEQERKALLQVITCFSTIFFNAEKKYIYITNRFKTDIAEGIHWLRRAFITSSVNLGETVFKLLW